jgi:hypothetical protein
LLPQSCVTFFSCCCRAMSLPSLAPAELSLSSLALAEVSLHSLAPAELSLSSLRLAELPLSSLAPAELSLPSLAPAELPLSSLGPAELSLSSFAPAELCHSFPYSQAGQWRQTWLLALSCKKLQFHLSHRHINQMRTCQ